MWWCGCCQDRRDGFATMGNGFIDRCGGVVVIKIGMMGLLPWVMDLLIGVVAWLLVRSE